MLQHTEAIKEINPMKLYQKNKRLSSETKEIIAGTVIGFCLMLDLRAFPCFIGLLFGVDMTEGDTVFGWLFAVQIAVVALCAVAFVYKAIRACRAPKRLGVIGAEIIREMEEKGCSTKS